MEKRSYSSGLKIKIKNFKMTYSIDEKYRTLFKQYFLYYWILENDVPTIRSSDKPWAYDDAEVSIKYSTSFQHCKAFYLNILTNIGKPIIWLESPPFREFKWVAAPVGYKKECFSLHDPYRERIITIHFLRREELPLYNLFQISYPIPLSYEKCTPKMLADRNYKWSMHGGVSYEPIPSHWPWAYTQKEFLDKYKICDIAQAMHAFYSNIYCQLGNDIIYLEYKEVRYKLDFFDYVEFAAEVDDPHRGEKIICRFLGKVN